MRSAPPSRAPPVSGAEATSVGALRAAGAPTRPLAAEERGGVVGHIAPWPRGHRRQAGGLVRPRPDLGSAGLAATGHRLGADRRGPASAGGARRPRMRSARRPVLHWPPRLRERREAHLSRRVTLRLQRLVLSPPAPAGEVGVNRCLRRRTIPRRPSPRPQTAHQWSAAISRRATGSDGASANGASRSTGRASGRVREGSGTGTASISRRV